jgi:hypothetical protein
MSVMSTSALSGSAAAASKIAAAAAAGTDGAVLASDTWPCPTLVDEL